MIPFLHLGPLTIPTYGLMVATGMLVAAYILQAEFDRRRGELEKIKDYQGHKDEAFLVIGIAGIAGLIGSRLYSALENPAELIAHPGAVLFSRFGFTWFGGLIGGFVVLVFMARRWNIPLLGFLDMCSPAGAVGYAFGRMGCLFSGDGDYGIPTTLPWGMSFPNGTDPTPPKCVEWGLSPDCRVHPTPVYEFLAWVAIGAYLWHLGTKALRVPMPRGRIFGNYLILTGIARFAVEFIRINPRLVPLEGHLRWIEYGTLRQMPSHTLFSFSNAQIVSLGCIVAGIVLALRKKTSSQLENVPA